MTDPNNSHAFYVIVTYFALQSHTHAFLPKFHAVFITILPLYPSITDGILFQRTQSYVSLPNNIPMLFIARDKLVA